MSAMLRTDVQALAEDFSRSTPEKFWDAAFWRDRDWLTGSLDVADRKRIVVAVLCHYFAELAEDGDQPNIVRGEE